MSSNYNELSLAAHRAARGKFAVTSRLPLETKDDLSIAYTPGVAEPCRVIAQDPAQAYELTMKGNAVAIVSDGTSVLGLGDIGPLAALPVMEGKAVLYKKYAGIDGVPIVLASKDPEEIIRAVKMISPTFGGIHLEDIAAPACFEIERRLSEELSIPVMHDDQHATAIVTLGALYNALKVVEKRMEDIAVVINGAGAAGHAIAELLLDAGVTRMTVLDSKGMIALGRDGMNPQKDALAKRINAQGKLGTLADAMQGADVVVGVSKPGVITQDMVRSMAPRSIVFALANPTPEIMPDEAKAAGAEVIATGRSDFANQVNNVLVYPGIFAGLLRKKGVKLTPTIKIAAAVALASAVKNPTAELIIPSILEYNPAEDIALAVTRV
ncbi:NAD-dependent malic enzyme [Patescibacteria group bacterium]|nr:NAD-dependent malic enzyme [Patescibacteria group bacterium]